MDSSNLDYEDDKSDYSGDDEYNRKQRKDWRKKKTDIMWNEWLKKTTLPSDALEILQDGIESDDDHVECLDLQQMHIDDEMVSDICKWFTRLLEKISVLNLSENKITSQGASELFKTLMKSKSPIEEIHLDENHLEDSCMDALGKLLSVKKLRKVTISVNYITDIGVSTLSHYLAGNSSLRLLDVSSNESISDDSIPDLLDIVRRSHVEDVDIFGTHISKKNCLILPLVSNILKNSSNAIEFPKRGITDDDLTGICDLIKISDCSSLTTINLCWNKFSSKGLSALFDTLRTSNTSISTLILRGNDFDEGCITALGELLQQNEKIECVSLGDEYRSRAQRIKDDGVENLASYLIGNTSLKSLDLSNHEGITMASYPTMEDLALRTGLTDIQINNTSIPESKQRAINKLLRISIEKRDIPIYSNTKSAAKSSSSTSSSS